MARHRSTLSPLLPALDPTATTPLHRQLFDGLREAILNGQLAPGARLPSTRDLARELGLSRTTTMTAFDQLIAEGYLEGRTGSGTFVSATMPGDLLRARADRDGDPVSAPRNALSQRGAILAAATAREPGERALRPFRAGLPALDTFPADIWARLAGRRWRNGPNDLLGYGDPAGHPDLRRAIADYLRLSRGVRCTHEQIVIVGGSQQGFDLAARLLLDPGDVAWVEDPGYAGVSGALRGAGITTVPVPVDRDGLVVAAGERLAPNAKLASVTPSHQYPAGVTMSIARRIALLDWAARTGAWVLEDDYDAEFRYAGRALEALQGIDTGERVIYLGTFSKVLAPALRLGYLVVPSSLVVSFTNSRDITGRHAPVVEQAVLADFMVEGHFARHLRRMRAIYAERQAALVDAARALLAPAITVAPAEAGLHVVGWLCEGLVADDIAQRAATHGVTVHPFVMPGEHPRHGLMLGYAPYTPRQIGEAMTLLARAIA